MAEYKNVVIVGATGNLGAPILSSLVAAKAFNITVLTRPSSKKKDFSEHGVKTVTVDYEDKSALVSAFKGQDVILYLVGQGGARAQKLFIDAAIEAGVKRFVPSEFGSDTDNKNMAVVEFLREKVQIKDYLREKASKGEIEYTFFQPGPFFDWCMKLGLYFFDLKNHSATILDSGDKQFVTTNLPTVGKIVAASFLPPHSAAAKNAALNLQSYKTSQNEILSLLEKTTGDKWKVEHSTSREIEEKGLEQQKEGHPMSFLSLIRAVIFDPDYRFDSEDMEINTVGWVEDDEPLDKLLADMVKEAESSDFKAPFV